MFQNLGAFVAVSAVVICTPGPDTALIVRNALSGGRRGGIATATGIIGGILVWTLAASAGVAALLSASEPVFRALQIAGAAYLVYLGLQSIVSALANRSDRTRSAGAPTLTPRRAFRQGLLSNLGNPKIAVFFVSLLPQFVSDGSESFLALAVLGVAFSLMGLAWLTLYAVVVAKAGQFLRGRVRRALDAVTGTILVAFGIRLAAER
ncbi:MAG TPA: LysE family translocator [Gaiellaceae bacterium]|nr:LysE family translocator [Gaiellaceae bacterium]